MADALALGASGAIRGGSSPLPPTLVLGLILWLFLCLTFSLKGDIIEGERCSLTGELQISATGGRRLEMKFNLLKSFWEKLKNNSQKEEPEKKMNTAGQITLYLVVMFIFIIVPLIASWNFWKWQGEGLSSWNTGLAILIVAIFYWSRSIKVAEANERDLVTFLGIILFEVSAFPVFVPWGLSKLLRYPRTVQEFELPGEPEQIFDENYPDSHEMKGQEKPLPKELTPKGKVYVRPIRVTFKDQDPETDPVPGIPKKEKREAEENKRPSEDPLRKRVGTTIGFVIPFEVIDPSKFYTTLGTIEEAEKQLGDYATGEMTNLLSIGTADRAMSYMVPIAEEVTKRLIDFLNQKHGGQQEPEKDWGIKIYPIRLKPIKTSHSLASEIQKIAAAVAENESRIIKAEAERIEREQRGRGDALARQLLLEAEAIGYKSLAEKLEIKESAAVLFIDALRKGLESGNHFFFEGENSLQGLFARFTSMQGLVKTKNES